MLVAAEDICFPTPSTGIHSAPNQLRLEESVLDVDLEAPKEPEKRTRQIQRCVPFRKSFILKNSKIIFLHSANGFGETFLVWEGDSVDRMRS